MSRFLMLLLCTLPLMAQQQATPKELDARQRAAFKRLTESVSTPCCTNGIPVAFHESSQALYVSGFISEKLLAGESEQQIMVQLKEMRLGPNKQPLIITTPENKLVWWLPVVILVLGLGLVLALRNRKTHPVSEDDLLAKYGDSIRHQVEEPGQVSS